MSTFSFKESVRVPVAVTTDDIASTDHEHCRRSVVPRWRAEQQAATTNGCPAGAGEIYEFNSRETLNEEPEREIFP